MFDSVEEFKSIMRANYFPQKTQAWDYCLNAAKIDGMYLEFGVKSGASLFYFAEKVKPKIIYGFDSWQGLPESWVRSPSKTLRKGKFRRDPPKCPSNVKLVSGLFAESIPLFCNDYKGITSFVHIDCDLYQSAKDVLWGINNRIVPGTVMQFDEICDWEEESYTYWQEHEYKALKEWCIEFKRKVLQLCSNSKTAGAVIVES